MWGSLPWPQGPLGPWGPRARGAPGPLGRAPPCVTGPPCNLCPKDPDQRAKLLCPQLQSQSRLPASLRMRRRYARLRWQFWRGIWVSLPSHATTQDMSWHGFVKPNTGARASRELWDTRKTQTYAREQLQAKNPSGNKRSLEAQKYLTKKEVL